MIDNLNNKMVELVKNKLAECYEEIRIKSLEEGEDSEETSKIKTILDRQFFEQVTLKFENDMYNYFNTNYQTCVRFGYEIIRKNHLFNVVGDDAQEIDTIKSKGFIHCLECCPTLKLFEFYEMIDGFIGKLYEE